MFEAHRFSKASTQEKSQLAVDPGLVVTIGAFVLLYGGLWFWDEYKKSKKGGEK